jgi:tetratricopeptide (TPR) repeat protein
MNTQLSYAEQAQRLREQAVEHMRSNRMQAAQDALQALIRIQPQDVGACINLSNLMLHQGRFRGSSAPLLTAMHHLPRHAPILLKLAEELVTRGEVLAARHCLDAVSQAWNLSVDVLVQLSWQRYGLGEIEIACGLMERALAAGADAQGHHQVHAELLEYSGRSDEARDVLENCILRWPDFGHAAAVLARMCKQTPQDNRLASVEEQMRRLPPPGEEPFGRTNVAAFEYARFKILDDLGRHEEAWPSLVRSNALMYELNPYDAAAELALADALVGMPAMQPGSHDPKRPDDGPVPIFIVGLPRSGTTLLDRMLSAHSRVASAGELIEFWRQLNWVADEPPGDAYIKSLRRIVQRIEDVDLKEVGRRYLEQTRWRAGGNGFYIDKLPANIQMVALIRRALPQARILNMVRDPMDVCFSNFQLFGGRSTYINDLDAIADYHGLYTRLRERWHALAPDMMLEVSYESLVRDPQSTMQAVLEYCGLEVEEACLHPERNASSVATPSSSQVREPIHTRSIGRWRAYAGQLEPLHKALASRA